jgi:hypothetical protein
VSGGKEIAMRGSGDAPADDASRIGVDHESNVDEARPGAHVSEVGEPEHVRHRRMELPIDVIERARRCPVADRRLDSLAADGALQAYILHQPFDRTAGDCNALAVELTPDLPGAIDLEVLGEDAGDLGLESHVLLRSRRELPGIGSLGGVVAVGRRGDRQNLADRFDPVNPRDDRR